MLVDSDNSVSVGNADDVLIGNTCGALVRSVVDKSVVPIVFQLMMQMACLR